MSESALSLYSLAHKLLTIGSDGDPIYADQFTRLNRDVYEQALDLYNNVGHTPESEAELCLALLVAFNATIYDNGRKQQYVKNLLDRSFKVLTRLEPTLLKVRLLTYCYGEVYEPELSNEAHAIIASWNCAQLTDEQREIIEELDNIESNPYPWEYVD